MKPYFLVLHNKIRFLLMKITHKQLTVSGFQLLSRNTKLVFSKRASVELEDKIINDGRFVAIVSDKATLKIGKNVYFNENVMISCHEKVIIGAGCQFGPNAMVFDNNHHFSASCGVTTDYKSAPICIGEHCWIGANVVILKGTTVGKNSVIGAGCIVSGNIPECSVVTQDRALHIEMMRK